MNGQIAWAKVQISVKLLENRSFKATQYITGKAHTAAAPKQQHITGDPAMTPEIYPTRFCESLATQATEPLSGFIFPTELL